MHVEQRQYVVLGVNVNKKQAKRWAGMRLLLELGKPIDPFFFKDTPEGALPHCCLLCTGAV